MIVNPTRDRYALTLWHMWFAWRPVRLAGGSFAWLQYVHRRGGYDHRKNDGHRRPPWRWEYRVSE